MLEQKITTQEEFRTAWNDLPYDVRSRAEGHTEKFRRTSGTWWDRREAARMITLYTTTSVLDALNTRMPYYAHISQVDKNLVAYTPDREAGEQDRQIRVSIGRLLQKMYPAISQNEMRELIETHNSEASVELEFVEGEAIRDVYILENGVGSCMAGERKWDKEYHPTLAYDAPGIKLAVLRKKDGGISARCLVYEASETDKRRVRNYGAPALDKALEKAGYKLGGLGGAKLRKVVSDPTSPTNFRLPYLDYAGGMSRKDACSVALMDGEIYVLTPTQYSALSKAGAPLIIPNSNGSTYLREVDTTQFKALDALTGDVINKLTDAYVDVWHEGKAGITKNLPEVGYTAVQRLWVKLTDVITVDGYDYINDPKKLAEAGLYKLDAECYPDKQDEWFRSYSVFFDEAAGKAYLKKDTVVFVTEDDERTYCHTSKIDKKKVVRLAGLYERKQVFADKKANVKRTPKGSKVHNQVHDLCILFNGEVDYSRGKRACVAFGRNFYYDPKTHKATDVYVQVGRKALYLKVGIEEGDVITAYDREQMIRNFYQELRNVTCDSLDGYGDGIRLPEELRNVPRFKDTYTYNSCSSTILELSNRQLLAYYKAITQRNKENSIVKVILSIIGMWIAEEEAVEAPHYLAMPDATLPEPVIEILAPELEVHA